MGPVGPVLRSPVGLSHAVVALLAFVVLADAFAFSTAVNLRSLMGSVIDGDVAAYSDEDLERADWLMVGGSALQLLALVATAAVFIVWFYRVRSNAEVFAPDLMQRGKGWAIGSWFIPIANLWIPRQIAGDVWTASRPDPYAGAKGDGRSALNLWWTVMVVSFAIERIASKQYDRADSAEELRSAANTLMFSTVLDIVAAVLAILFVRRLTRMQHTKATGGAPAPGEAAPAAV
ncbi:DUF4328 domain-containing protein [Streptomyces sp. NPDC051907]|uniref:DUF4328 domain-containing protein n=1 Tax=Streptomyces sp. NPDC051907 TaxID=3155284 RepID=UPI003425FCC0